MSAAQFVLWGHHPDVLPQPYPIRLTGGSVRELRTDQRDRVAQGWQCGIYREGDAPVGLRLQVAQTAGVPACATCGNLVISEPGPQDMPCQGHPA